MNGQHDMYSRRPPQQQQGNPYLQQPPPYSSGGQGGYNQGQGAPPPAQGYNGGAQVPQYQPVMGMGAGASAPQKGNLGKGKTTDLTRKIQKALDDIGITSKDHPLKLWTIYGTFVLITYFVFSGGDFSVLLTMASVTRSFAFLTLLISLFTSSSSSLVSLKTLHLYLAVFAFRLLSLFRHEGYLPYDKTGDWFYHFVEMTALLFTAFTAYTVHVTFRNTYEPMHDSFGGNVGGLPSQFGEVVIFGPCLLLAILIHPTLNSDFVSDVSWTFSMYLESLAVLPQLYLFQKGKQNITMLTAHFVVALGLARVFDGLFWMHSFTELTTSNGGRFPGVVALVSQLAHLVMICDFFWYYARALKEGGTEMVLPSVSSMV